MRNNCIRSGARIGLALLLVTSGLSLGCAVESGDVAMQESSAAPALVSVTEVTLRPDGHHVVRRKDISQPQLAEMQRARDVALAAAGGAAPPSELGSRKDAIARDTLCDYNSLWLRGPEGELLCFQGTGTADLKDYCRVWYLGTCQDTWAGNIASVYPGSERGAIGEWIALYIGSLAHWHGCNPYSLTHHGVGWYAWDFPRVATSCENTWEKVRLCESAGCGDY